MATKLPAPLRLLRRDTSHALRFMRGWFVRHGNPASAIVFALFTGLFFLVPLDSAVIATIAESRAARPGLCECARLISYFGDFLGFNLVLFVGLQVAGWLLRSRRLLRVAVASLLCAFFAGVSANSVRCVIGRPRPCAGLEDKLYGPSFAGSHHSLPSAHAATAFGGALSILFVEPVIGAPLTVMAGAVGWSRLQLNRHHLTDVLASVVIALLFSLPLSRWVSNGRIRVRSRIKSSALLPAPHVLAPSRLPH